MIMLQSCLWSKTIASVLSTTLFFSGYNSPVMLIYVLPLIMELMFCLHVPSMCHWHHCHFAYNLPAHYPIYEAVTSMPLSIAILVILWSLRALCLTPYTHLSQCKRQGKEIKNAKPECAARHLMPCVSLVDPASWLLKPQPTNCHSNMDNAVTLVLHCPKTIIWKACQGSFSLAGNSSNLFLWLDHVQKLSCLLLHTLNFRLMCYSWSCCDKQAVLSHCLMPKGRQLDWHLHQRDIRNQRAIQVTHSQFPLFKLPSPYHPLPFSLFLPSNLWILSGWGAQRKKNQVPLYWSREGNLMPWQSVLAIWSECFIPDEPGVIMHPMGPAWLQEWSRTEDPDRSMRSATCCFLLESDSS